MSESQRIREKGNKVFRLDNPDFSFGTRIQMIEEAKHFYVEALKKAANKDEETSAANNVAAAFRRLAHLYKDYEESTADQIEVIREHTKSALVHFARASISSQGKDVTWRRKLDVAMKNCLDEALEWLQPYPVRLRLLLTEEFILLLPSCDTKGEAYNQFAETLLNLAVESINSNDYKEAFRYMKECIFPLKEATSMGIKDEGLETDLNKYMCVTEAMEEKSKAEDILKDLLFEHENLNMDMVWETIDHFCKAINCIQEKDIQREAQLISRIAHIYHKVLKMQDQANTYYRTSYELALSTAPHFFADEDWYKECQTFLNEYQRQKQKELNQQEEKAKKQIKEEIKEDLKKLEEQADKSVETMLKSIYTTWPPKDESHKLDLDQTEKKMLFKAVVHYHPDKQDKKLHGMKWVVLCSEISKVLNSRYENFKGL